jgi:predicted ArsR family transcriptional regulator
MTQPAITDPPAGVKTSARRTEVLTRLREAARPLTVAELAEATGLHVNTARFHLDGLVSDGLAERSVEPREAPGRPPVLYAATPEAGGLRSFGLLAEMLTGLVKSYADARPKAAEAGRAWGQHLVQRPAPSERLDEAESTARLMHVLDALGFQPELRSADANVDVRLHNCPFREVAERHSDVVCSLHLGLIQGALGELRAPLQAETIEPFVTPNLCVARLSRATGDDPR